MNQTPHGRNVMLMVDEETANSYPVLIDVLAILSGVNFSSIRKVIAAMNAVQRVGIDLEYMTDLEWTPTQHARFDNTPESRNRVEQARLAVSYIARETKDEVIENILKLGERIKL